MDTTQPPWRSEPGSATLPPVNLHPPNMSDLQWTVIVWDAQRSRHHLISHVMSACGARPRWVEDAPALQQVEPSQRCQLAVVALGSYPSSDNLGLEIVRSWKQKGFKVISYEEGAQSWPLGVRCQVLLAGSLWLLDGAKTGFAEDLQRILAQLLQAEAERLGEEDRLKRLMKMLGIVGKSQALTSTCVEDLSSADDPTGRCGTGPPGGLDLSLR